ncbi:MAG: M16 family metallopeptidase [Alphaproteobacteria bacterium]
MVLPSVTSGGACRALLQTWLVRVLTGPVLGVALGVVLAAAAVPASAAVFSPRTFTLANGLQVVVVENHRLPVVRHMVFYRVGAADDPLGKSGLAHYLEHLMFKGTKTIAPSEFSKIVARNGGRENAFTSADTTAYYQTVAKDRLELMMKIESDRMANLVITAKEAVPELQVVIEERRSRVDNRPAAQLDEQVAAALYMNHPYKVPIIGWQHELEKLTVDDAIAFYKHHYAPNNAILILAGDVTVEEIRPLAEKYYGKISANPAIERRVRLQEPPQRAARRVTMRSDRVREPRFSRDYLAPSHTTGETQHGYALEVLSTIVGGGTTSRLYRGLVIEKALALGADAYYDGDVFGPTSFGFSVRPRAGVGLDKVEAALDDEIRKLVSGGVSAEELASAKKRLLASAVFARDSLRQGAISMGVALTTGRTIADVEEWPDRIEAVTREQVLAAARHVLKPERSVTALLLPEKPAARPDEERREKPRTSRTPSESTR